MGKLKFDITGDSSNFIAAMRQAEAAAGGMAQSVAKEGDQLDGVFKKLAGSAAAIFSISTAKNLVKQVYEVRSSFQDAESSLATFLGSAEKGTKFFNELKDYAWYNMFEFSDLLEASNQLIAFGNATEDIIPIIDRLSNVASGTNKPLAEYIDLWNKAKSTGTVGAEYMQSWAAHGIVLKDTLKEMGVEVSGSTITFEQLQAAIAHVTDEGGRFNGLMANMMENLSSSYGQLQDDVANMLNELGERWQGAMKKGIEGASALIDNYDKIGKALAGLIAAYGSYKVVLAATAAIQKSALLAKQIGEWVRMARALGVATANQVAFNNAAKLNPYVAVASAVIGVATALVTFNKRQSEAARMQAETTERITEETKALKDLYDAARDQTKSEGERKKAIEAINSKYGELLDNQLSEKASVGELAGAYNTLTAAIQDKQLAQMKEQSLAKAQSGLNKAQAALYNRNAGIIGRSGLPDADKGALTAEVSRWLAENAGAGYEETMASLREIYGRYGVAMTANRDSRLGLDVAAYKQAQDEFARSEEAFDQFAEGYKSAMGTVEDASGEAVEEQRTAVADIEANLRKTLARITELRRKAAGAGLTEAEAKELTQANTDYDAAAKKYKAYTGRDYGKTDNAQANLGKTRRDAEKAEAREMEDLENELAQAEIDALADGAEKTRKQRELDNKLELQQVERAKQDYIDALVERSRAIHKAEQEAAAKDSTYKPKAFDEAGAREAAEKSDGAKAYDTIASRKASKQEADRIKAEAEAMQEYLIQYGSYEEKKLATAQKYAKLIAAAETEGEAKSLAKKKEEELYSLEQEYKKTASAIQDLFGDMSRKTSKDLYDIADAGEEALEYIKGGVFDAGNEFGISEAAFNKLKDSPDKLKAVADAIRDIREQADSSALATTRMAKGVEKIFKAKGNNSVSFGEGLELLQSGLSDYTKAAGSLSGAFSSMGDALGQDWMTEASSYVDSVVNVASSTMDMAMAGAQVGGAAGAAIGAAIGLATSLTTEISKAKDAAKQARIEKWQEQVEDLQDSYDELGDAIDNAYSTDKAGLLEQQRENLRQQNENYRKMIDEENSKKKTDKSKVKEWEQAIKDNEKLMDDAAREAQEAINGISFDTFRDKFKDAIMDMDSTAEDWADDINDMLRDALVEQLLGEEFSDESDALLKRMSEAIASGDTAAFNALKAQYDELYRKYREKVSDIDNALPEYEGTSRSSASKGVASASQDSVDELNGRATAIQSHTFSINERMESMVDLSSQMLARLTRIDMNTARLEAVEEAVGYIKDDLGTIRTRGITIRT